MLLAMSKPDVLDLIEKMSTDTALYAEIVHCDILTDDLTDDEKIRFIKGTLPREVYMPVFHQKMYAHYDLLLANKITYMSNVLFRGGAKSTIKNIVECKIICYMLKQVSMYIGSAKDQSAADALAVQDIIQNNPIIRILFGKIDVRIGNAYKKVFYHHAFKKEHALFATGMNSKIRGLTYKKRRPNIIWVDDFEDPETNCRTKDGRKKTLQTIKSKILRMGDYIYSMIFQGTIAHHEAFLATIKNHPTFSGPMGRYLECPISKSPSLKYDSNKGRWILLSKENFQIGTPSWPARYGVDYIKQALGEYTNERGESDDLWQMLQELYNIPKTDTEIVFDVDKIHKLSGIKFRTHQHITYLEMNTQTGIKYIPVLTFDGVDPAAGRELHNDRFIKMTIAVPPGGNPIIIDIDAGRYSFMQQLDIIINSAEKYKPTKTCIETFGVQLQLYEQILDKKKEKNLDIRLVKYNRTSISKSDKLKNALTTLINTGKVSYIAGCRNIDLFLEEVAGWSIGDTTDDTLDAFFDCLFAAGKKKANKISIEELIKEYNKIDSPFLINKIAQERFCESWKRA